MWKLSGDDIQTAKQQLQEQRAALQAHYDGEVSRLDGELADIERVERFAVSFASRQACPIERARLPVPGMMPPDNAEERIVQFRSDGLGLSLQAYARLLAQIAETRGIAEDDYSRDGVVGELETRMAALLGKE